MESTQRVYISIRVDHRVIHSWPCHWRHILPLLQSVVEQLDIGHHSHRISLASNAENVVLVNRYTDRIRNHLQLVIALLHSPLECIQIQKYLGTLGLTHVE